MSFRCSFTGTSSSSFKGLGLLLLLGAALPAVADVCVWRDPEQAMTQLFPEARDYRTLDMKIPPEKREAIERRLGRPLDPGERENWTYYEITGPGDAKLGYVIADAEKGEYGVIEMVMGLTLEEKAKGVYIQRSRERKTSALKSPDFLSQFAGKSVQAPLEIGKDLRGVEGAEMAAGEVAFGVKKMLVFYDELAK